MQYVQIPSIFNTWLTSAKYTTSTLAVEKKWEPEQRNDVFEASCANPLLHGETAAIANCSKIITTAKEDGGYGMAVAEVVQLLIRTVAESSSTHATSLSAPAPPSLTRLNSASPTSKTFGSRLLTARLCMPT